MHINNVSDILSYEDANLKLTLIYMHKKFVKHFKKAFFVQYLIQICPALKICSRFNWTENSQWKKNNHQLIEYLITTLINMYKSNE